MPSPNKNTKWHPLLNAVEKSPGVWTMIDASGHEYGTVRITREGGAIVYICELGGTRLGGRNVKLREAVEHIHNAYVRSFSRPTDGPGSNPRARRGLPQDH